MKHKKNIWYINKTDLQEYKEATASMYKLEVSHFAIIIYYYDDIKNKYITVARLKNGKDLRDDSKCTYIKLFDDRFWLNADFYLIKFMLKSLRIQTDRLIIKNDLKRSRKYYNEYMKTFHWQIKRHSRFKIDNYKCQLCGTDENLQVHHINYNSLYTEDMDSLITLCNNCHRYVHRKNVDIFEEIEKIVSELEIN